MDRNQRLSAAEIESRLDEPLDPVLTSRRTAAPLAEALARCERAQQQFALRWVEIIAKSNSELAYQFAARVPEAFTVMDLAGVEDWIIGAMDVYDTEGLYPASATLAEVKDFALRVGDAVHSVPFEEVAQIVELFVRGLSGRPLKVEAAEEAYTDTETLHLPSRVGRFPKRADNFRLYKAVAALLWAQTWYGTYRQHHADIRGGASREEASLTETLNRFADPERARRRFQALETLRLEARIAVDLPGLHRDMQALQQQAGGPPPLPPGWVEAARRLARPHVDVLDSLALLTELPDGEPPAPRCYEGRLFPERAEQVLRERIRRDRDAFRTALARQLDQLKAKGVSKRETGSEPDVAGFAIRDQVDPQQPERSTFELLLDGQPVVPVPELRALSESIIQDLGHVPGDYLVPAGDGGYRGAPTEEKLAEDVWKGTYHELGAYLYNEWDFKRGHYRKNWCVLRETDVHPQDEPFVARTLEKYAGVLSSLRKTFEALRGEDRLLKKQISGDDIDFDALVEAHADMHHGMEMSERLFVKLSKLERNIAVMFMVDMSGSTKGWINDAEREALALLCEALEILGDRYAIYGFSGMTRKRCELYRIKRFNEPYADQVRRRISGIRPQDYTRMGVTIRHLTKLLNEVDARTKLLITLSDGKPDDYDGYRGEYGIEDTRMALIEAKRLGIHPFCITIDTEARDYLPHMYGAVNWALVDDVRRLPLKVSDIYRRLTL